MWYQLHINQCQAEEVELLTAALEASGALSITLTDRYNNPVLEPEPGTTPLWPDVSLSVLYDEEQTALTAKELIHLQYPHLDLGSEYLAEQDWERTCLQDLKPQCFGERLWVCPSWIEPPEPKAVNLILSPGLAFGTGTHPTTALCLSWLEQADLKHKTLIDYGCGSGILALAALKLGASYVYAIDIDKQALQATASNARLNHIDMQHLQIGFPQDLNTTADIIIANILLSPLLELEARFKQQLQEKGLLIISGILNEQAQALCSQYQAHFTSVLAKQLDGWSLLVLEKRTIA